MRSEGQATRTAPFLRWAGGKQNSVGELLTCVPLDVEGRTYWEPFVGAGSLFFAAHPQRAFLSDANAHLIGCYRYVAECPDRVWAYLRQHAARSCEDYYYEVRDRYNRAPFSAAQAARFIYLNRTCFNGVFRVNKRGQYNVPYGGREPPVLPTLQRFRMASAALRRAQLAAIPFEQALARPSAGDFVYLDPPYPPLNGTSNFAHYTVHRFNQHDQCRLARLFHDLDSRGCLLMMSNADTPLIRALYARFNLRQLSVTRYVTCKNRRHRVSELVITNYPVPLPPRGLRDDRERLSR